MNREEFTKKINDRGLGGRVVIKENNYTGAPNIVGCFKTGNKWIVYENNERGTHEELISTTDEDEAFNLMYDYVVGMSLI